MKTKPRKFSNTAVRIWLDDERDPKDPTIQEKFGAKGDEIWVRTVDDAIALISQQILAIESVSLDNDLGVAGSENEGFRVAAFIEAQAWHGTIRRIPELKVHSANPVRSAQMQAAFSNAVKYWNTKDA